MIDQSDISGGLTAVSAVGDDRIQKTAREFVSPETFTHGTSEERSAWFRRGLDSGEIDSCDTFSLDGRLARMAASLMELTFRESENVTAC